MIKLFKLITSEEVVGEVTDNGESITIKRPCAIMLIASRSTPDQHSMALIPYAGYTRDHVIDVDKRMIVWSADLADDILNQYNAIFGSGIQIVTAKTVQEK
jgi:hypothetical protein